MLSEDGACPLILAHAAQETKEQGNRPSPHPGLLLAPMQHPTSDLGARDDGGRGVRGKGETRARFLFAHSQGDGNLALHNTHTEGRIPPESS